MTVCSPFETIEGAQEYIGLLAQTISESRDSISTDIDAASAQSAARRLDALRLVDYKLKQLEHHMYASARLLNDLRTLRRLLLGERDAR